MNEPLVGQRIRLLAQMTNPDSSCIPVEDGMAAGLEGTVVAACFSGPRKWHQISVRWDNGRTLAVLPAVDRYELLQVKGDK
jgi:hypothetical protein